MKSIKLMNRVDTKFVTSVPRLMQLLEMARDSYRVQQTDGRRIIPYYTLYFDTPELSMYNTHHCGRLPRQKARIRSYVASQLHFLEVKTKNNHRRTRKKRIEMPDFVPTAHHRAAMRFTPGKARQEWLDFLDQRLEIAHSELVPQVENQFNRITLVNNAGTERVTIDTSLRFHNLATGRTCDLTGIAIIELKRDSLTRSPILELLRQLRIKKMGFSKYCMGTALTNPAARVNRFKVRLHRVEKIRKGLL